MLNGAKRLKGSVKMYISTKPQMRSPFVGNSSLRNMLENYLRAAFFFSMYCFILSMFCSKDTALSSSL